MARKNYFDKIKYHQTYLSISVVFCEKIHIILTNIITDPVF